MANMLGGYATCVAMLLSLLVLSVSGQDRLTLHVDDRDVYSRAGYFFGRYLYRGGVPKMQTKVENYDCLQSCTNSSCALGNRPSNILTPYCVVWSIREYGYGDATGTGTCRCSRGTSHFCAQYTCDQTVTAYNTVCDDECFATRVTFGKFKSCSCVDFPLNVTSSNRCGAWTCLGYGDGPVKTADWSCYKGVSQLSNSPVGYTNDFCWFFGSDQTSDSVQEVKDCQCVSTASSGSYCDSWVCYGRLTNNWIWYSSIIASPVALLLNFWVPIVFRVVDDVWPCVAAGVWCLLTYLLVVLLGGVPSLIANTGALILVALIVNARQVASWLLWLCSLCRCGRKREPEMIDGVSLCPTCQRPWGNETVGVVTVS